MVVAKWLQKQLERFKLPTEIRNEIDTNSRHLRPVFRDQSDLNTGVLGEELRKNLEKSKYLILICSKNSAQSQWVSEEAKAFVEMGRLDRIIPVIIPDVNTSERNLFPKYLQKYFQQYPDKELLGVNIGEVGKEKALIRVISRMLDVSFDSLWKRHQRQKRLRSVFVSICAIIACSAAYLFAIPITVCPMIEVQPSMLPMSGKIVLNIEGGEYTSPVDTPRFENIRIPGYKRFSKISIKADSKFFEGVDTAMPTGYGLRRNIKIRLLRDQTFAVFSGTVYDEEMEPLSDVEVTLAGYSAMTDSKGFFTITIPLEKQQTEQSVTLQKSGYNTLTRSDEPPGTEIKYIMHK